MNVTTVSQTNTEPSAADATSRPGRLPDFLIIGAAKCGTTTLFHKLGQHPDISMASMKEPEFFSRDERYERGLDWYRSLFAAAEPHQRCGEASGTYTWHPSLPDAAGRIARTLPDVKLIYIMRHPIERAYSHYIQQVTKHVHRDQPISVTFEQFIEDDPCCLESGNYLYQIEQYLAHFSRDRFLFLFNTDLASDGGGVLDQVCRFVGVGQYPRELLETTRRENDTRHQVQRRIREKATAPLKRIPGLHRVAMLLPQSTRNLAYAVIRRTSRGRGIEEGYTPPPMLLQTRRRLAAYYADSVRDLGQFLQTDLSAWQT